MVMSNRVQSGFSEVLLIGVVWEVGLGWGFFFAGARTFFVTNFF